MSLRTRFVLSFGLGGVFFLLVITVLVFSRMESAMESQLKQQFQIKAYSRMDSFDRILTGLSENFQSIARLPMFKSMRFHQLTLNQAAFKNDVRQMELYILELINQNTELSRVSYIDKHGFEVFRVDRTGIKQNLSDMTQDKVVRKMLELKPGNFSVTQESINNSVQNINWWVPIYVPSGEILGVMSFSISYKYVLDTVEELVTSDAEMICFSDLQGVVLFSSNSSKNCVMQDKNIWQVSEKISLPGVKWLLYLSVNPDVFLVDVNKTRTIVFAVIFPVVAALVFFFTFVFSNKIIRAINQLVDAARIIGRGEQLTPITLDRDDELGELAAEMNRSAKMLEVSRDELLEAKKRDLQAIMDHSPAIIYVKNTEGRYTFINQKFEQLFHIKREDIIGKTDYDVFSREHADEFQRHDKAVLEAGHALKSEERTRMDDGMRTYISIKFPLLDSDNNIYAVCGISTDITEWQQTEEALRRSQKMEAIGQLSGGIAHDFNNQLGVIIGYLDFLKDYIADDEQPKKWVDIASRASLRCMDLTRQLLAFSRHQGKETVVVNLNTMFKELEIIIARSVTPEVEVQYFLVDDLWLSEINPGEFQDAILNLVINARDVMSDGGKLLIETSNKYLDADYVVRNPDVKVGEYVQLMLSDTGSGMDKATLEHIFEPFFTTKPTGEGTGLGLSMVYGFVKRYGGHIKVYSEPGVGTTIRLYLPRSTANEPVAMADNNHETELATGSESILIVDDEPDLLALADQYLSDLGYRTCIAESGAQALAILEADEQIDMLFSDVVMPGGMNGYELAQHAIELRPGLKVLLTSGFTSKTIAHNGLARFAAHLLSKPYRKADLAERIRLVFG